MGKIAVGLVVAVVFVAAAAQEAPPFRTGASYVRVDVFPTVKGEPVVDLKQDDFEILEDKVPQKIAAFEHVAVHGNTPDELKREPRTVAESRAAVAAGRGRVFVLFLDPFHVEALTATKIRRPLVSVLDRALGDDDLIAAMTPDMAPRDLTFTPRHATVDAVLSSAWGQRDRLVTSDPTEDSYRVCYPPTAANCQHVDCKNGLSMADAMIERRREYRTFEALRDLVRYLGDAREERKAVVVVTDGWQFFTPDQEMARPLDEQPATSQPAPGGVDPRTGRPARAASPLATQSAGPAACQRDRMTYALMDDEREEIEIEQQANRSNVSFYPLDPRGLAALPDESPSVNTKIDPRTGFFSAPEPAVNPRGDIAKLSARLQSLRALAESTDGVAIVNSNNFEPGLRKMANDLSSYYLLGYNSTGKLDGKFHSITVRVKRPGVDVRARKGFLASTAAEATARSRAAAAAPATVISAETAAVTSALGMLGASAREEAIHFQAVAGWHGDKALTVWATADVSGDDWKNGGEIDVSLVDAEKRVVATEQVAVPAGATPRGFRAALTPASPVAPGAYSVVAKARGTGTSLVTDTVRLAIPAGPASSGALMFRRGPSTGNKDVPTADARFRRTERIRIDVPAGGETAAEARLLDRTGRAMSIPLAASIRQDADGSGWRTTQLALAPLATGDYVIEITRSQSSAASSETDRSLVAFRIVP